MSAMRYTLSIEVETDADMETLHDLLADMLAQVEDIPDAKVIASRVDV